MNSFLRQHPSVRWGAPVAVVALVAAGQAVTSSAQAAPTLPSRTPEQLVAAALKADVPGLSGTLQSSASLGLPSLPDSMTQQTLSGIPLQLLTGDHTEKVWFSKSGGARLALLGKASETDLIAGKSGGWLWNSGDQTLMHQAIPADGAGHARAKAHEGKAHAPGSGDHAPNPASYTPQGIAKAAIATIRSSDATVSSDANVWVAGRKAYDLVVTPTQSATKIGSIHIAIDSKTSVPLRVQVFARGASSPALNLGFTAVSFKVPNKSVFEFSAPKGVKVTPFATGSHAKSGPAHAAKHPSTADKSAMGQIAPKVVGKDWASVLVANLPKAKPESNTARSGGGSNSLGQALQLLPKVSGSWGSGRLLDTALFSAVITDSGRVAFGAVQPSTLYAALAG